MTIVEKISSRRLLVIIGVLLIIIGATHYGNNVTSVRPKIPHELNAFPKQIGQWNFSGAHKFTADIEKIMGADEYISYRYTSSGRGEIEILISYYSSMREGRQYHSPRNCMLGSGWENLEDKELMINWRGGKVPVNLMKIRKNTQYYSVIYWVQGRERLISSEYQERLYRVIDSFIKRRTDGAFVRILLPDDPADKNQTDGMMASLAEIVADNVDIYLN